MPVRSSAVPSTRLMPCRMSADRQCRMVRLGARSSAQLEVLRAWLAVTRRPGWERRRAALVAAAIWPDFRLQSVRALLEDPGYITFRLARRLVWLSIWTRVAPLFGTAFRRWARAARTRYRRWLLHTQ